MGLFGRKKQQGFVITPESERHSIALVTGQGFAQEVQAGHIPPPAHLWINRFANADPMEWAEETAEALSEYRDPARYEKSKGLLLGVLARIATQGGNIGEITASEESVTLHITVETIVRAEALASAHPDAVRKKWTGGRPMEDGWIQGMDSGVWLLCCEAQSRIRDVDQALTMRAFMVGDMDDDRSVLQRPDRVVKYTFMELDRVFSDLAGRILEGPDVEAKVPLSIADNVRKLMGTVDPQWDKALD